MQLFHFSENPGIGMFTPRPVLVPSRRPPGREWLNSPLVWAIDDWHQPMYLFPRDCPRILIWRTEHTTAEDHQRYWGTSGSRMIAFVEERWFPRLRSGRICRYALPLEPFESLEDAGMWVSRTALPPLRQDLIADMSGMLALLNVDLRPQKDFLGLKDLWTTSLHVSGIRLRNAAGWEA